MKYLRSIFLVACIAILTACSGEKGKSEKTTVLDSTNIKLALEVKAETKRTWDAYKKYAWGHDVLKPLSKSSQDWYEESLYISPIDAYSTLHLMGFKEDAKKIENYVVDSLDFNKNINAKIFEVNIRILGGLLSMYELSGNPRVLEKTVDFADRMMPAFDSPTGIPYYFVNLKTGEVTGNQVNVAEAGSYTFEMGILSYFTGDPKYYQAGKRATKAVFDRRSDIDLIAEVINVETGEWQTDQSHICAGIDSYYEYMYKTYILFGDQELKDMWDTSIAAIQKYMPEEYKDNLYYQRVHYKTGEPASSVMTLYDVYFPAILGVSGDMERAERFHKTWDDLWNKYGLEPMIYDYKKEALNYPVYDLNPEITESAYYLYHLSGKEKYLNMSKTYWADIKEHCMDEVAFHSVENVETMEPKDYMPTFFFAETLKYLYLSFAHDDMLPTYFDEHVFNTEAHPFEKSKFEKNKFKERLGME